MSRRRSKMKRRRAHISLSMRMRNFYTQITSPRYATISKLLGETPLEAAERLRELMKLNTKTPLAYAGRLDPMATGKLLILIGNECKRQARYHTLDKEYRVELLFGIRSDSGDVLGIVEQGTQIIVTEEDVARVFKNIEGKITLAYPHFSSKTVEGKPLHMWAIEKRLSEIEIPEKQSTIHSLRFDSLRSITKSEMLDIVRTKVESIPKVTDPKKHIGADFRRIDVRAAWNSIETNGYETYQVLSFTCIASSGTYMRALSERIATDLGTTGLALSIHRTIIGKYLKLLKKHGFWLKKY